VYPYDEAKRLAAELTRMGCDIITGGGPGLMQAANEGVMSLGPDATGRSIGVRVDLPFEQEVNPFVGQMYEHKTFFSRLHHFMIASDALVVVPGGIGTLLELAMVWQLLQVRGPEPGRLQGGQPEGRRQARPRRIPQRPLPALRSRRHQRRWRVDARGDRGVREPPARETMTGR
jgi:hypothetical protein